MTRLPPRHFWVGPHAWFVNLVEDGSLVDCVGATHADTLVVDVDVTQPQTLIRSTLLHEILHVCCPTLTPGKKDDAEETFVAAVEPFLFAVLADPRNRGLVNFIIGNED